MTWKKILIQKMLKKKPSTGKQKNMSTDLTDLISQGPGIQAKRKRKGFNPIDAGRKRQRKTMEQKVDSVDRISHLPEHIIHHILSFMRCKKDAARTSTLSKRWGQIWASFSNLEFDERKFQFQDRIWNLDEGLLEIKIKKAMFQDFVDDTLQSRIEQKISIQRFMLHLTSYDNEMALNIGRWIRVAVDSNIQELYLHVPVKTNRRYLLPRTVLAAKTITALRVYGCKLGTCSYIKFSRLQKLCLGKLHVDEQMIQNLISSCPLIEDLRLVYCSGLKTFQVSSLSKLNRVDLHHCHGLKMAELDAPDLETFWYHGKKSMCCKINLATCKNLKCWTLEDPNIKGELFQNQISNFPVLEKLVLSKCNVLKRITISSYRLKTLILRECKNLKEADIDTPNLLAFEYKGDKMPFTSLNPSGLKEAKLYFDPLQKAKAGFCFGDDDRLWFAKLQEFLGKFDHSQGLKFVVRSNKNIIIHEDLREILLPPLYDLKLEIIKASVELDDLLDNLLRSWHPKTLSIVSSSSSNFPKLVHEKIMDREEETGCCRYNISHNKCWRHFLKNAKIENCADNQKTSDWIVWLKSSPTVTCQTNCYTLNWKPHKHGKASTAV